MKLFLASTTLPAPLQKYFVGLLGKPAQETRVALIENAADPYPAERRGFIQRNRNDLIQANLRITNIDLRDFLGKPEELEKILSNFDVMCFGGGNTFYLRYIMRESGFDKIAPALLEKGIVYMGGSAGAIVAGPTLKHFEAIDEPEEAPEILWEGLSLVDFIPLPHWNTPKFQEGLLKLQDNLLHLGKELAIITDEQAIVVEDGNWKIVSS